MQQKIDDVIFRQERLKKQVDSLQTKVQVSLYGLLSFSLISVLFYLSLLSEVCAFLFNSHIFLNHVLCY